MKHVSKLKLLLFVVTCFYATTVWAAADALIDATFFDKNGAAIPDYITNNTGDFPTATGVVSFCTEAYPISVNIHAQLASGGAGAEFGSVTLTIAPGGDGTGDTYTGTLDMAGNYTISSIDIPVLASSTATQTVTVTLNADATYNESTASGSFDICAGSGASSSLGLIYSDVANTEAAWMWDFQNPRVAIGHADLGLTTADNIDALSLGDDTLIFGSGYRYDYFAVNQSATGASGDVLTRAASSVNIQRDLYVETGTGSNRVCLDDLVSQSGGGTASGDIIDGFDFGDHGLLVGDWLYFSLETGSPALTSNGWSAGDVLTAQYMVPGTLTRFAAAADIGNPADIDALSIHDHAFDGVYDGAVEDYIIYSTVGGSDVQHYGYGVTGGGSVHDHSSFGLLTADEVVALEHKTIPCCNNEPEVTPSTEDVVSEPADCGGASAPESTEGGSSGCSAGTPGSTADKALNLLLVLLGLLALIACRFRTVHFRN